jgi:non-heme Fe2+,alpha-ketoglutarate-dependent halogenase
MRDAAGSSEIQAWVIGVCQELGLPLAGPDDDFFASGGTSLTAIKFLGRVEERFGEDALPVEDLFERSSVRDIAASIRATAGGVMTTSEP